MFRLVIALALLVGVSSFICSQISCTIDEGDVCTSKPLYPHEDVQKIIPRITICGGAETIGANGCPGLNFLDGNGLTDLRDHMPVTYPPTGDCQLNFVNPDCPLRDYSDYDSYYCFGSVSGSCMGNYFVLDAKNKVLKYWCDGSLQEPPVNPPKPKCKSKAKTNKLVEVKYNSTRDKNVTFVEEMGYHCETCSAKNGTKWATVDTDSF